MGAPLRQPPAAAPSPSPAPALAGGSGQPWQRWPRARDGCSPRGLEPLSLGCEGFFLLASFFSPFSFFI